MIITIDGEYILKSGVRGSNGGTTNVLVSGVFGTAGLVLGYYNEFGTFIGFTDGTITQTDSEFSVSHGIGITPILQVTTANGSTNISVVIAGKV